MKLPEKTFYILDALDRQEIFSQRQLADSSGISLGQVNYLLKSLLEKGLVKVNNFRKNPNKISYAYLLTAKGIETRSRLAVKFVIRKLREFDDIKERLIKQLVIVEKTGLNRVIFFGPPIVEEFLKNLIIEKNLNIILVDHYTDWKDLMNLDPVSYDVVLLFDDNQDGLSSPGEIPNISRDKLLSLW